MSTQHQTAIRYLQTNYMVARARVMEDNELLDWFEQFPEMPDREGILLELEHRFELGSLELADRVHLMLNELAEEHAGPGRAALSLDRLVQRLLHLRETDGGRQLALSALLSGRSQRQEGAYKFLAKWGLDESTRLVMSDSFPAASSRQYKQAVTGDAELIVDLGVDDVLGWCDGELYWQASALCSLISASADTKRWEQSHLAAWVWGISMARADYLLPRVADLIERHADDVDIVNRGLLCGLSFDRTAGPLERIMSVAGQSLGIPRSPQLPH